jgi:hypothetical protein
VDADAVDDRPAADVVIPAESTAHPALATERRGGSDRFLTDLSCTAQPGPARAPIAGSTAA